MASSPGGRTVRGVKGRFSVEVEERLDHLSAEVGALRLEMQKGFGDLRFELLRWSFLFGMGQLAALAGILSFMLYKGPR